MKRFAITLKMVILTFLRARSAIVFGLVFPALLYLLYGPIFKDGLTLILLIYLLIAWIPNGWWTRAKYTLAVCLVIVLILILHRYNGQNSYDSSLLIPLVLLLAKEQQDNRRFMALLAIMTMAILVAISPTYTLVAIWMSSVIPLYVSIRAISIYKEAHRLSQIQLQEIDKAHHELQQTHTALQEASVHSMRYAALAERSRLAREMHDGLGHQLTSLIVQLQALNIMLPGDPTRAATTVPAMLEVTRKAMAEVRQAASAWSEDESQLGLVALQGLISQSSANTHLTITFEQDEELSDWSTEMSVTLYRILQEALTNIMRHTEATTASIQVIMIVSDNGGYMKKKDLYLDLALKAS
jgi:signal transduction histidine kinase